MQNLKNKRLFLLDMDESLMKKVGIVLLSVLMSF